MSVVTDVLIDGSGVRDQTTGAALPWPAPVTAPSPIDVDGFGPVHASVQLGGLASLELPTPPGLQTTSRVTIEVVAGWKGSGATGTLLGGPGPISIRLADSGTGIVTIEATIRTTSGARTLRAVALAPSEAVSIAVVAGEGDAVLVVGGVATDRRPLVPGARLDSGAGGSLLIGGDSGPSNLLSGRLWALRIHDGVPDMLAGAVTAAADGGLGELAARHEDGGGDGGRIGAATGAEQVVGGIRFREHVNAMLCWSAATGVHEVRGAIRDRYRSLGGPLGALGLPTSDEISMAEFLDLVDSRRRRAGGGSMLRFRDLVVQRVEQAVHVVDVDDVSAAVRDVLADLQPPTYIRSDRPPVGVTDATPSVLISADTPTSGFAEPVTSDVLSAVRALTADRSLMLSRWNEAHPEQSPRFDRPADMVAGGGIDYPIDLVADEIEPDVQRQALDLATAFVRNADLSATLSGLSSALDEPIGRIQGTAVTELVAVADRAGALTRLVDGDGIGWVLRGPTACRFERGAIVCAPENGAIELFTDVLVHWLRHGGSDGLLGMPLSADVPIGAGRTARFVGGLITWSPTAGAHEVHGAILDAYLSFGGPTGFLGFPISDEVDVPGGRISSFEDGDILWSSEHGAHEIHGAIREAYLGRGGADRYGVPTTNETSWVAPDGSGVEVRHSTFATGEVLAWVAGIGVFDHLELDLGSVRSGEIDDEVTSDDQPELFVHTRVWVDGAEVRSSRTPTSGYGPTGFALDGIAPTPVPLHVGASVRLAIEAWDKDDYSPDDQFAAHDITYTLEDGFFGWLSGARGSHAEAPSTWDSGDAGADTFKVSYTLTPPYDELARFDLFRQEMFFSFRNFKTSRLGWDLFSQTFEDVLDSSGSESVDDLLHPHDGIFFAERYKEIADGGNCLGFSLVAANTFHRRTGLSQPLIALGRNAEIDRMINRGQGIQVDEATTLYKMLVMNIPGYLDPRKLFDRVQRSTERRIPVMVCMRGVDSAGRKVGHATVAYGCDGSSSPKRIWLADCNDPPPKSDDNGSRIEIDANGAFRVFAGAQNTVYGAGAFSGALGNSYLYDIPVSVMQGPHYTPDWLVMTALSGALGAIMLVLGDAEASQISGGGYRLFGDQRVLARERLNVARSHLELALAARLVEPIADQARLEAPSAAVELSRFSALSALSAQVALLRPLVDDVALSAAASNIDVSSVSAAVSGLDTTIVEGARDSWLSGAGLDVGAAITDIDDRIAGIDLSALIEANERVFTPGAWSDMAPIPLEQAGPGEMYAHRGPLPDDLQIEVTGRAGGGYRNWVHTNLSGAMVSGTIEAGGVRTLHLDRLSTLRPGVRVETEVEEPVKVGLTVAVDSGAQRWLAWDATVTSGPGAPSIGLTRAGSALGVVVETATAAPVVLRSGERVRDRVGSVSRWQLASTGPGERLVAEPVDPASPFGALAVERLTHDGELVEQVTIDPMP